MAKYHRIISITISIGFLILLQEFSFPHPVFRLLLPFFLLFAAVVTAYNRWYLRRIHKYNSWVVLRPVLFFASMFGLFNIIDTDFLRGVFLLAVVCIGAVLEYFLADFAENIILNETLLIAFGIFMTVSAYALLYAPGFQTYYLAAIFAGTFLTTRSFYEFIPESAGEKTIASVALAFFCTEVFWAMTFLPPHYSASALMLLNVFYFCLVLNYYYAFNTLTLRKLQFHFMLMVACSGLVFLLTPWKILG